MTNKVKKTKRILFPTTNNQNRARCRYLYNAGHIIQDQEINATDDNKTERKEARAKAQANLSNTTGNMWK